MRQRFVTDTEDQIPRMIGKERNQTPPVLPSTAGRQIWVTPELQKGPHSPVEEVEHDEG